VKIYFGVLPANALIHNSQLTIHIMRKISRTVKSMIFAAFDLPSAYLFFEMLAGNGFV